MMQRRKENNFDTCLNDEILVEGSSMAVFPASVYGGIHSTILWGDDPVKKKNLSEVSA